MTYMEICQRKGELKKGFKLELSQKQFDGLEVETKRAIMMQLVMVVVESPEGLKMYSLATANNMWLLMEHKAKPELDGWEDGVEVDRWN